jgi:outer membrane lipoprotein-sorting protein
VSQVTFSFCLCVVFLLTTSCAQSQKALPEAVVGPVVSNTPPFQTKEPERYRAVRTITTVNAAGIEQVMKHSIARDGELRRDESELGGQRLVYLNLPEGMFVLLPQAKVFADATNVEHLESGDESESSPDRLLHTEPIATTYQRTGNETLNGRTTQKYRVVVKASSGTNVSGSETVIWIDETLQMPIKSETKSTGGARTTMELSQIALDVDRSLFRIPEDYEKITFTELRKRLKLD